MNNALSTGGQSIFPEELVIKIIKMAIEDANCEPQSNFAYTLISNAIHKVMSEEFQRKIQLLIPQKILVMNQIEGKITGINKMAFEFETRLQQMPIVPANENDQKLLRDDYSFQEKRNLLEEVKQIITQNNCDHDQLIHTCQSMMKRYLFVLRQYNALKKHLEAICQIYRDCFTIETIRESKSIFETI